MPVRAFPFCHFHFLLIAPFFVFPFFHCEERERLRQLRESLAARRRTLSAARLVPAPPLDGLTAKETQELHALSTALARARSGLVQELVEVFHVVEVGGRPPIGGKAGTKGEWTIGDLILPVPGDIRRTCVVLFRSSTTDIRSRSRLPPRPYQRRHHARHPFPRITHVLFGRQTPFRDGMDRKQVWGRTTVDRGW